MRKVEHSNNQKKKRKKKNEKWKRKIWTRFWRFNILWNFILFWHKKIILFSRFPCFFFICHQQLAKNVYHSIYRSNIQFHYHGSIAFGFWISVWWWWWLWNRLFCMSVKIDFHVFIAFKCMFTAIISQKFVFLG